MGNKAPPQILKYADKIVCPCCGTGYASVGEGLNDTKGTEDEGRDYWDCDGNNGRCCFIYVTDNHDGTAKVEFLDPLKPLQLNLSTTKSNQEIVRTLNKHLNIAGLAEELSMSEWNCLISLLELGRLTFSGDPSGFHIKNHNDTILDCSHPDTTLVK